MLPSDPQTLHSAWALHFHAGASPGKPNDCRRWSAHGLDGWQRAERSASRSRGLLVELAPQFGARHVRAHAMARTVPGPGAVLAVKPAG